MKPLYFSVDNKKPLMVVPETNNIYKNHEYDDQLEKRDNPNYKGFITFELPDKLFS